MDAEISVDDLGCRSVDEENEPFVDDDDNDDNGS